MQNLNILAASSGASQIRKRSLPPQSCLRVSCDSTSLKRRLCKASASAEFDREELNRLSTEFNPAGIAGFLLLDASMNKANKLWSRHAKSLLRKDEPKRHTVCSTEKVGILRKTSAEHLASVKAHLWCSSLQPWRQQISGKWRRGQGNK